MFYGPGAGALPTATSVLSDVVAIAKNKYLGIESPLFNHFKVDTTLASDLEQIDSYYIALKVNDLAKVQAIFTEQAINIKKEHQQSDGWFVICEPIAKATLKELTPKLSTYAKIERVMKVIGE